MQCRGDWGTKEHGAQWNFSLLSLAFYIFFAICAYFWVSSTLQSQTAAIRQVGVWSDVKILQQCLWLVGSTPPWQANDNLRHFRNSWVSISSSTYSMEHSGWLPCFRKLACWSPCVWGRRVFIFLCMVRCVCVQCESKKITPLMTFVNFCQTAENF